MCEMALYPVFLCGSVVEHCVTSAKGCGFDSQGTHILTKNVKSECNCKSLWIKASDKCKCPNLTTFQCTIMIDKMIKIFHKAALGQKYIHLELF